MTDETFDYLTAMRLFGNGTDVEMWSDKYNDWVTTEDMNGFVSFTPFAQYRRKPRTITLAGVEFPEPLKDMPEESTKVWTFDLSNPDTRWFLFDPLRSKHRDLLAMRLLQSTHDGAEQQRRAMVLSVGGEP